MTRDQVLRQAYAEGFDKVAQTVWHSHDWSGEDKVMDSVMARVQAIAGKPAETRTPEEEKFMGMWGYLSDSKQAYAEGFAGALEKRALTVLDREALYKRPISGTLGRLNAPLTALTLGSTAPFRPGASLESEDVNELLESAKDDPELHDLLVSLGGGRPLKALARIWKNKRTSVPTKLFGTAQWPLVQAMTAIGRGDHYDPHANMVVNYNDDPAILSHEIGHAKDFSSRKMPGLYSLGRILPPVTLYQEGKASRLALAQLVENALKDDKVTRKEMDRINRANRVLGGGLGSYAGNYAGALTQLPLALPGALVGQMTGAATTPFIAEEDKARLLAKLVDESRDEAKGETEETEEKAAAYELGILAGQRANVPGHLKQTYAEGFGAGLRKRAMPRGLGDVPVAAGPAQMAAALQLLGQARALGTPTHGELEDKGVTEKGYSRSLRRMKGKKKLSDARTDKVLNMVLGGLLGGVAGAATKDPLNAVVGAGIGTGAGALRAHVLNKNVLKTLKVLKDRGVLTPELLDKAYPVLMSPRA